MSFLRVFDRFRRLLLPAVAFFAAGAPPVFGGADFPLAATGDIWFQTDHAGFLGEDGQVIEEYYVRITNNQLTFKPAKTGFDGKVFIQLRFKDGEDRKLGEAGHSFSFTVREEALTQSPDHAQLLLLREPLDPRAVTVEVVVEDMNARKRGLLYLVTGKRKNGSAEGTIIPPPFLNREFGISDLQFAWEVREEETDSPFGKNGLNVIPNPGRTYGLLQPRLSTYYEVYDLRDIGQEDRTYQVHHELVDLEGTVTRSKADTVVSASGEWVKVVSFDLSHLATGQLMFRAVVHHLPSGEERVTERPFNLIWRSKFWNMTEQDLLDEARVLFSENEYIRFKDMSSGDRALYMDQFWSDIDPSPGSAHNEIRGEFLRRVEYANRQFSDNMKGMLTDRGRMYIRFGEADEIERVLMPTVDNQLDGRLEEFNEQISGSLLRTHDDFDTRPYEIWNYTRQGTPLFPERETTTSVTGLRFVFVDETGMGHYVLRYASDFIAY